MYRTRSKEKEKWDDNRLHSPLGRGSGRGRRLLAVPPLRRLPRPGNGLLGTLQCILLVLEELDVHLEDVSTGGGPLTYRNAHPKDHAACEYRLAAGRTHRKRKTRATRTTPEQFASEPTKCAPNERAKHVPPCETGNSAVSAA